MAHAENKEFFKGRGAQVNTHNKFSKNKYVTDHIEGLDEELHENSATQIFYEDAKKIISTSNSPDLSFMHSINPYQGCEHGCLYCYARNAHEYWGFSAGLDFERKIIAKKNAAALLEESFNKKNYQPATIMLSGNTDCYQPIERKLKITRSLLEVFLKYKHPVSIISKNNLITRDFDILQEMAKYDLVHVAVTLNSLNERLRKKLEPRTVTGKSRLKLITGLAEINVPVRLMMAPIIPFLNSDEIPVVIKAASDAGASGASFTMVRLNGVIAEIFTDWIYKAYPDRADKVLHAIASCHGGKLNDSRWGNRMVGDGHIAESIHQLFKISLNRFMKGKLMRPLNFSHFTPGGGKQLTLF
ncbi:MAG TPA: PA0069 family radical SAM protein [Sphingobacteriaceae bacterium]